jgi:outer membrane protein OmpA-like peptidoglycan-associated protein
MRLLGEQRAFLKDAPAGLADVLGTNETTSGRRVEAEFARAGSPAAAYEMEPRKRSSWPWVLPLLLLIPLLGYFMARRDEPRREAAVRTTPAPAVSIPMATPDREKPVGTTSVPSLPLASGPYWIRFDTGSRAFTAASSEQLRSVAEILRTHPRARAEVSGYTDNTGNEADNLKLSQERATIVMNEIASLGIAPSRMTAEGLGESNPVADNATLEGRQRNRRVEVRITEN